MLKLETLCLAVALTAAPAFADDDLKPAQEEMKDKFEKEIEAPLRALNDACGTKLKLTVDWKNFDVEVWSSSLSSVSYCQGAIEGVAKACERPAYKKAIAKKVTGVACLFKGASKPTDKDTSENNATLRSMSIDKGVFTYKMLINDHSNLTDHAVTTIEKAFK